VGGQLVGQQWRKLGVQRWQDVLCQLDEVDLESACGESLDRFEADESGTDNNNTRAMLALPASRTVGQQILDALFQRVQVGHGAKGVHGGVVQAIDRWTYGHCTWGQQ
jgi:hypothetical protein